MKIKLVFSIKTKETEQWTDLTFVPRIQKWLNVQDILKTKELEIIKKSANCCSGVKGIESAEYRHDDNDFYEVIYSM